MEARTSLSGVIAKIASCDIPANEPVFEVQPHGYKISRSAIDRFSRSGGVSSSALMQAPETTSRTFSTPEFPWYMLPDELKDLVLQNIFTQQLQEITKAVLEEEYSWQVPNIRDTDLGCHYPAIKISVDRPQVKIILPALWFQLVASRAFCEMGLRVLGKMTMSCCEDVSTTMVLHQLGDTPFIWNMMRKYFGNVWSLKWTESGIERYTDYLHKTAPETLTNEAYGARMFVYIGATSAFTSMTRPQELRAQKLIGISEYMSGLTERIYNFRRAVMTMDLCESVERIDDRWTPLSEALGLTTKIPS